MSQVVFLDTETTGLDPDRHQIWELAIITATTEWEWQLPVDLARADPTGLRIGRFYERRRALKPAVMNVAGASRWRTDGGSWMTGAEVLDMAETVAVLLDGNHMVGAVPSFDAAFIGRWLRANGQAPCWHYHLVDVEALAAGKLGVAPPWNTDELSTALGIEIDRESRHTALGDARWAKRIYEAVLGGSTP